MTPASRWADRQGSAEDFCVRVSSGSIASRMGLSVSTLLSLETRLARRSACRIPPPPPEGCYLLVK